jgi:hypothetical protein
MRSRSAGVLLRWTRYLVLRRRCGNVLGRVWWFGWRYPIGRRDNGAISLTLRQTEELIGSVIALLGLALTVPDHSTMCRRSRAGGWNYHRSAGSDRPIQTGDRRCATILG